MWIIRISLLSFVAGTLACANLGPRTIVPDRIDYNQAVAESWKEQILLNIVRLRYSDTPVFIEVSQIIGGYSIERSGRIDWNVIQRDKSEASNWLSGFGTGAQTKITDRPTITYTPLTGARYIQSIMTPLPPESILFMIQAGWAADALIPLAVQSVNGVRNRWSTRDKAMPADPEFYRLCHLMREIQDRGGLGMRIEEGEEGVRDTLLVFLNEGADSQVMVDGREIRKILGLSGDVMEFRVSFIDGEPGDDMIRFRTRSVMSILKELGSFVELPIEHTEGGFASPTVPVTGNGRPLVRIHSSLDKPTDAFAAIEYDGYWFWVDKRDHYSKGLLSFMVIVFAMSEEGTEQMKPLVTVPVN